MKIVFATNNKHKLDEVRSILGDTIEVLSLADIGCTADIPETGLTLEENARQKAEYIYERYGLSVFADDTGLEVDALGGAPGIYSARYAAMEEIKQPSTETAQSSSDAPQSHDSNANMNRLMRELGENNNRKARFRTVIALYEREDECFGNSQNSRCSQNSLFSPKTSPKISLFEGIVEGEIIRERRGGEGFGYDPIFRPDGYDKTFAELGNDIKNTISHRARATQKLVDYINKRK